MYITGFVGVIITTSCLAAMTAEYAGTKNKVGNGFGIFFMFLYLAFQGYVSTVLRVATWLSENSTFCDTTMYLYVSEIFPTEIRPIGMGFSLFGQFAGQFFPSPRYQTDGRSYNHPPPNCTDGLQQRRLEVLSRDHLLVCRLHPR